MSFKITAILSLMLSSVAAASLPLFDIQVPENWLRKTVWQCSVDEKDSPTIDITAEDSPCAKDSCSAREYLTCIEKILNEHVDKYRAEAITLTYSIENPNPQFGKYELAGFITRSNESLEEILARQTTQLHSRFCSYEEIGDLDTKFGPIKFMIYWGNDRHGFFDSASSPEQVTYLEALAKIDDWQIHFVMGTDQSELERLHEQNSITSEQTPILTERMKSLIHIMSTLHYEP